MNYYQTSTDVDWAGKNWEPGSVALSTTQPPSPFTEIGEESITEDVAIHAVEVVNGEPAVVGNQMTPQQAQAFNAEAGTRTGADQGQSLPVSAGHIAQKAVAEDSTFDEVAARYQPKNEPQILGEQKPLPISPQKIAELSTEENTTYDEVARRYSASEDVDDELSGKKPKDAPPHTAGWAFYEPTKKTDYMGEVWSPRENGGTEMLLTTSTPPADSFKSVNPQDMKKPMPNAVAVWERGDSYGTSINLSWATAKTKYTEAPKPAWYQEQEQVADEAEVVNA